MTNRFYGYYESPIGLLEIICTEEALISALFVTEKSEVEESHWLVEKAVKQFDEYFKGQRRDFDLPLAFGGTIFQKSVWEGLTKIPFGETWSYKQLATELGNEKATRAVGNANSKNLISIVVPCHRVIGANKTLTGYAGGLDRKQWLLEHESTAVTK